MSFGSIYTLEASNASRACYCKFVSAFCILYSYEAGSAYRMQPYIRSNARAVARVHDVASARGGLLKGEAHGERVSVACFGDLEDVR